MQEQGKEDVADGQINIKKEPSPVLVVPEDTQSKWNLTNDIYAMTNKLDSVLELIQDQQQEISELRVEVIYLLSYYSEQTLPSILCSNYSFKLVPLQKI